MPIALNPGHEVVEVDGFTFIRKREAPKPAVAPSPKRPAASPLATASNPLQQPLLDQGHADGAAAALHEQLDGHGSSGSAGSKTQQPPATPLSGQAAAQDAMLGASNPDVADGATLQPASTPGAEDDIMHRLSECLPDACPVPIKLQFVVSQLLADAAAKLVPQQVRLQVQVAAANKTFMI